jgi:hypothetical protein
MAVFSHGLCFAEDTILLDWYFITNFVIVVDTLVIFMYVTAISLAVPVGMVQAWVGHFVTPKTPS